MEERLAKSDVVCPRPANLQTVILETGSRVDAAATAPLLKALRKAINVTVEVHHRTADEGHKLALKAKRSASRSTSTGLLSFFWCLRKHAQLWDDW